MPKKYELKNLIETAGKYLPSEALETIKQAYAFISERYPEKAEHVLHTAVTVAELQLDEHCITATLLHNIPIHDETAITELEKKFGVEVLQLVEGMAKLGKVTWTEGSLDKKTGDKGAYAESLRKMLMAMVDDIRVVFIKLACILHEVSTLKPRKELENDPEALAEAEALATETMEVYAPIAHRLGIWQLKWQMEDKAFRYKDPEEYNIIKDLLKSTREEREVQIAFVENVLKQELDKAGIEVEVTGRPKHIYSVVRKQERYKSQGKDLGDIYDLLGLRILVKKVNDCYGVLGIIHNLWHPLPGEFNDYIANPRGGIYQAIHTTVMLGADLPLEIQIRTHEMHRIAEYGLAAHWRYKEGKKKDEDFDKRLAGLRFLLDRFKDVGGIEFFELMEIDVFGDSVMVYTPRGEIKDLPTGSTPLDFAYRIHTELGHRCVGAKVNGKMVPLTYKLKTGDTVEIVTSKGSKGPSRDWLNPDHGYLRTSHAREKVRQWFRKQERGESIERGKELLEKEMRRLGISISEEELAELFKKESADDFLAAIGYGDISTHQIANRLSVPKEKAIPETAPKKQGASSGIQVMGMDNLLTQLAPCCNPMPGDDIIGYITRTKGVSVHRKDCSNIANTAEKERLINVKWGVAEQFYTVPVRIEAFDRVGLLRDISTIVAEEGVNIASANTLDQEDGTSVTVLTLHTKGLAQLSRLFSKLEGVTGIVNVTRTT